MAGSPPQRPAEHPEGVRSWALPAPCGRREAPSVTGGLAEGRSPGAWTPVTQGRGAGFR